MWLLVGRVTAGGQSAILLGKTAHSGMLEIPVWSMSASCREGSYPCHAVSHDWTSCYQSITWLHWLAKAATITPLWAACVRCWAVIAYLTLELVTQVLKVSSLSAGTADLAELPWLCFGYSTESQLGPLTGFIYSCSFYAWDQPLCVQQLLAVIMSYWPQYTWTNWQ